MNEVEIAKAANRETHEALQTVYNALNKGQRQKILKNEEVKALFEKFKVETEATA